MNLVERVARLLVEIGGGDPDSIPWADGVPNWKLNRADARHILEAIREGSGVEYRKFVWEAWPWRTWTGIIDAELAADIEQHGPAA